MPCFWVWAGLDSLLTTEYDQSRGWVTKKLWFPFFLLPCYELRYAKYMRQKLTLLNTDSPGLRPPLPTPEDTAVPAESCIWTLNPQEREIMSVCGLKLRRLGTIRYMTTWQEIISTIAGNTAKWSTFRCMIWQYRTFRIKSSIGSDLEYVIWRTIVSLKDYFGWLLLSFQLIPRFMLQCYFYNKKLLSC